MSDYHSISDDNSQIIEKIYPKIETLDTLMSIVPRRIGKKPIDYLQTKNQLINQAIQQEKEEENTKQIPTFIVEEFDFPGENELQAFNLHKNDNNNNQQDQHNNNININGNLNKQNNNNIIDTPILQLSGNPNKKQLLEMKIGIEIPQNLINQYSIEIDKYQLQENNSNQLQVPLSSQNELPEFLDLKKLQSIKFTKLQSTQSMFQDSQIKNNENNISSNQEENDFQNQKKHKQVYINLEYKKEQEVLFKLLNNTKLKRYNIEPFNDFYLNSDKIPTMKDINKRAEVLAKLYMKFQLNEDLRKQQEENEDIQRKRIEKERKQKLLKKIQAGEDPNTALEQYEKEQEQHKFEIEGQKSQQGNAKEDQSNQDKSFIEDQSQASYNNSNTNNKEKGSQSPTKQSVSYRQSQLQRKSQQVSNRGQFGRGSSINDTMIGAFDIQDLQNQFLDPDKKRLEKYKEKIASYYQEISVYLDQKVFEFYKKGQFKESIKIKTDKEKFKQQVDSIQNVNDAEITLRSLLQYKFVHNL